MADSSHRVESRDINSSTAAAISPHVAIFDPVEEVENETLPTPVSPPSLRSRESYRLRELHGSKNLNNYEGGQNIKHSTDNEHTARGNKENDEEANKGNRKISKQSRAKSEPPKPEAKAKSNFKQTSEPKAKGTPKTKPPKEPKSEGKKSLPPSTSPPIEPTIPEPVYQEGDPTPAPIKWNEKADEFTIKVSTMLILLPTASAIGRSKTTAHGTRRMTMVVDDTVSRIIRRDNIVHRDDNENELHKKILTKIYDTVLTTMLNILCGPSDHLIVPASIINGDDDKYVDFCVPKPLYNQTEDPTQLYRKTQTVLTYEDNMKIQNRETADGSLYYLDWTIPYNITELSSKDGNATEIKRKIDLEMGSSFLNMTELLDHGIIGLMSVIDDQDPVRAFKEVLEGLGMQDLYNPVTNSSDVDDIKVPSKPEEKTISDSIIFVPKVSDTKLGFFSATRIIGFSLFFGMLSIVSLLIHVASKRMEDNSWDAPFMGDLATEEGVGQMLSSGRENVITSGKESQKQKHFNDSFGQDSFGQTLAHKRFNGGRRDLDTQSAL